MTVHLPTLPVTDAQVAFNTVSPQRSTPSAFEGNPFLSSNLISLLLQSIVKSIVKIQMLNHNVVSF